MPLLLGWLGEGPGEAEGQPMAPGPAHTRILFLQISGLGKQWDSTGRNILAEAAALTGLKKGGVGEPPSEPLPRAQLLPHEAGLRPGSSPLRGALVARAAEAAGTRWRGGYSTWWPEGPKPPASSGEQMYPRAAKVEEAPPRDQRLAAHPRWVIRPSSGLGSPHVLAGPRPPGSSPLHGWWACGLMPTCMKGWHAAAH